MTDHYSEAIKAAAEAIHNAGWTCVAHEPLGLDKCKDCAESTPQLARKALAAALPALRRSDPRLGIKRSIPDERSTIPLNTFNLSNSAISEFDPNTLTDFYPEGTLLMTESGIAYRACKKSMNLRGETHQPFTISYPDGTNGYTNNLPEDAKVVWFPAENSTSTN